LGYISLPDAKLPTDEKSKAASSIACPITSDIVAVEAQLLFQYVDPILKVQDHCRKDRKWCQHIRHAQVWLLNRLKLNYYS
jgi:hypothetical protein